MRVNLCIKRNRYFRIVGICVLAIVLLHQFVPPTPAIPFAESRHRLLTLDTKTNGHMPRVCATPQSRYAI